MSALQAYPPGFVESMAALLGVAALCFAIGIYWFLTKKPKVQRPTSEATSFPPPPPPDTITVKCEFCGTEQKWQEACGRCGAPLPKPNVEAAFKSSGEARSSMEGPKGMRLSVKLVLATIIYLFAFRFGIVIAGTAFSALNAPFGSNPIVDTVVVVGLVPLVALPVAAVAVEVRRWLKKGKPSGAPAKLASRPSSIVAPSPSSTVMVTCSFCGKEQPRSYECDNCGNPMPKPGSGAS